MKLSLGKNKHFVRTPYMKGIAIHWTTDDRSLGFSGNGLRDDVRDLRRGPQRSNIKPTANSTRFKKERNGVVGHPKMDDRSTDNGPFYTTPFPSFVVCLKTVV